MPEPGKLILLTGYSCSGKTELARALQEALPDPWIFWGADYSQPVFPSRDEFVTLANDEKMLEGNLRAVAGYIAAGLHVVAELAIRYGPDMLIAREVLEGCEVAVVALTCPIEVLEQRERDRGSTNPGFARLQYSGPSLLIPADLILQTDRATPAELASQVASWLDGSPNTGALWRTLNEGIRKPFN